MILESPKNLSENCASILPSNCCPESNLKLLDEYDQKKGQQLRNVASAYRLWDLFNHRGALDGLKKLDNELPALDCFRPRAEALEALEELARGKNAPKELLLIDIFNNAERRAIEGRYDDALARLYRVTELLAQYVLERDFEIMTDDVDIAKVPEHLHDDLERLRDKRDDKIKTGLDWDYRILESLCHTVGHRYAGNEHLQGQLRQRNQSILAHGLNCVTKSSYKNLKESIIELIGDSIEGFASRAAALQFPWLDGNKIAGVRR
ncbi:MAG: TIGR02710 family CRISPR-associated CARF protein [Desulfomonilia bacterium]